MVGQGQKEKMSETKRVCPYILHLLLSNLSQIHPLYFTPWLPSDWGNRICSMGCCWPEEDGSGPICILFIHHLWFDFTPLSSVYSSTTSSVCLFFFTGPAGCSRRYEYAGPVLWFRIVFQKGRWQVIKLRCSRWLRSIENILCYCWPALRCETPFREETNHQYWR